MRLKSLAGAGAGARPGRPAPLAPKLRGALRGSGGVTLALASQALRLGGRRAKPRFAPETPKKTEAADPVAPAAPAPLQRSRVKTGPQMVRRKVPRWAPDGIGADLMVADKGLTELLKAQSESPGIGGELDTLTEA